MANRITMAIERTKTLMETRLKAGLVDQGKLDNLNKTMDLQLDEFVRFQELKSLAHCAGKLTLDEAQTVYAALGQTPEHFNRQPLETKVVLTQVYSELLQASIKTRI